jgi:hypothetical protein
MQIVVPTNTYPVLDVPVGPVVSTGTEVRRSVRLKVKGLAGSGASSGSCRDKLLPSSCPLLTNFPFTRLSHDEILDLFRS